MLATAPINNPPALPPSATRFSGRVTSVATRWRATAMKSVKVFFFSSSLPCSYQGRPSSPPPRTCATTNSHAAVQQRQPGNREPRVLARLVGAVAVQQRRRGKLQAGAVDDRHRHPHPVGGDRPVAALHVVLGAVIAEHRLFAQQRPFPRGQVDVVDAYRGDERRRADPQLRRVPVRVGAQPRRHQLGLERDLLRTAVLAVGVDRPQLNPRQRLAAVADHQMPDEGVDGVEAHVVAVLDQRAERGRVADRGLDQREVLRAVVVQDQEAVLAADDGMLDGVFDQLAARPARW